MKAGRQVKTVPLGGRKAAGRVALVDDEDYELVMQYRWYVQEDVRTGGAGGPYARGVLVPSQRLVFMHNLIVDFPKPDHIDGNGLNNQRSNLRSATRAQNGQNRRKQPGTSSRYKGVTKKRRRWTARITYNGTRRSLGTFASEEEAALAYDAAARKLFGEYARPNFPERRDVA